MGQPDHHHFRRRRLIRGKRQLTMALERDLPGPGQPGNTMRGGHGLEALGLTLGGIAQPATRRNPRRKMKQVKHIAQHHLGFSPPAGGGGHNLKRRRGFACKGMAGNGEGFLTASLTEDGSHRRIGDRIRGEGSRLIEHRQRITNRAFGGTGNPGQGLFIGGDRFLAAD